MLQHNLTAFCSKKILEAERWRFKSMHAALFYINVPASLISFYRLYCKPFGPSGAFSVVASINSRADLRGTRNDWRKPAVLQVHARLLSQIHRQRDESETRLPTATDISKQSEILVSQTSFVKLPGSCGVEANSYALNDHPTVSPASSITVQPHPLDYSMPMIEWGSLVWHASTALKEPYPQLQQ